MTHAHATLDDARAHLQRLYGYPDFRPSQRPVVEAALAGHDVLAVLPTGAGKSLCFQMPAVTLGGVTLVISPLVALMHDQVAAAVAHGVSAASWDGTQDTAARHRVCTALRDGALRLLYCAPESLPKVTALFETLDVRPVRLAVDEAHCISEWGHDFRPAFRRLGAARTALGHPPVLALTGSATPDVRRDLQAVPGLGAQARLARTFVASFDRQNLRFAVRRARDDADRLSALRQELVAAPEQGPALVYVPTRGLAEGLVRVLREWGIAAWPYHAGLSVALRREVLARFLETRTRVVVATSAFGMGIDQPRVRLVAHWGMPPTLESYYQEAGRAGRDGGVSRCVVLTAPRDGAVHHAQLASTFPPRALLQRLWAGDVPAGTSAVVRASAERLHAERAASGATDLVFWEAMRRRRDAARVRLDAVARYAAGCRCRRALLLEWFGERVVACAGCDRCGMAGAPGLDARSVEMQTLV